jgi:hypothetical protein
MKANNTQNKKSDNLITLMNPSADSAAASHQPAASPHMLESLRKLQRADAFFKKLTDDQQDTFLQWLNEMDDIGALHRRVNAPPPEGLGVLVSLSTIRRFRIRYRALNLIVRTEEMLDEITDLEMNADLNQTARIQKAINHFLHESAYNLSQTHPESETLKTVLASIEKLSSLDFKKQKIQLEREKLASQFNSPKHHRVDLNIMPVRPAQQHNPAVNPPDSEPRQAVPLISDHESVEP